MSPRPLVFGSGLTLGDFLLWHWSLSHHHDTLSLIAGLTLPPLGAACVWLMALAGMRQLARQARLPGRRPARATAASKRGSGLPAQAEPPVPGVAAQRGATQRPAGSSSGRLAA